jgi:hypothetical protein
MLDVRDAMLAILDEQTLADLAAPTRPRLDRPGRRHAEALAGLRRSFVSPWRAPQRRLDPVLERPPIVASARAIRDASRASASE